MEGMDPVTCWGSIDWSLEFWGKTLYPARDAHLVLLHHKGEDGRRFFFFGCRLLQKMSGRCGPVNGRNSAAMCYLQATHMPYAPGLCPSCRSRWPSAPPRRSTGPQGRPSPGARAARAFWASHVAHLPLPLPIARTPAVWTVLPHTALPRTAAPRPAMMDSSGLGSGHWGIRGPEGPSGDGAKAGPRPATSDPGSEGLAADLKKRRHPCLEQPLADQHHRTISVVPFLPSCRCRPSRRRALPTVIPPRPSAALDVTTTAAECPSTT